MDGNGLIIKVSEISTNIFHGPAVASGGRGRGRGRRRDEDDDIPAGGGYHFGQCGVELAEKSLIFYEI